MITPSSSSQATDPSWQIFGFIITLVNSRFRISCSSEGAETDTSASSFSHIIFADKLFSLSWLKDAATKALYSESTHCLGACLNPTAAYLDVCLHAFLNFRPGSDSKQAAEEKRSLFDIFWAILLLPWGAFFPSHIQRMNCSISFQRDVINSGVYVLNVYFADMFCVSFKPKSLPPHSSAAQLLSQSGANAPLRKIIIQKVIKLIDQGSDSVRLWG